MTRKSIAADIHNQRQLGVDDLGSFIGRSYETDRAIANDPTASVDALTALAESSDFETRKNVACNIATPADVLISLAEEFPGDFFSHPLLDLMILEDPGILRRLKPGVLKSYLSDPTCPESFVLWACRHGYKTDQLEILKRPDLSVEQLKYIARGPHPKAVETAIDRLIEMGESW